MMRGWRRGIAASVISLALVLPAHAEPQSAESDWNSVQGLSRGARVVVYARRAILSAPLQGPPIVRQPGVISGSRVEVSGTVAGVDADELVLTPPSGGALRWVVRREDVDRVVRIESDDSIENGLLLGAVIGAGSWLVLGVGDTDLDGTSPLGLALGAAAGAVLGAAADGVEQTETAVLVYQAPARSELEAPSLGMKAASVCRVRARLGAFPIAISNRRQEASMLESACVAAAEVALR